MVPGLGKLKTTERYKISEYGVSWRYLIGQTTPLPVPGADLFPANCVLGCGRFFSRAKCTRFPTPLPPESGRKQRLVGEWPK